MEQRSSRGIGMRAWLLAAWIAALPSGAVAIDVTACGQDIPPGQTADLVADLHCPSNLPGGSLEELSAVYLGRGARLRLNGFALSGGDFGVGCGSRCTIEGPGTIREFPVGVLSYGATRVENVVFEENSGHAIHLYGGKTLRTTNVTILDADGLVAIVAHRLKAQNVTIERCWYGITAISKLVATDLTIRDCGQRAIGAGSVRATRLTVVDNAGKGIIAGRIALADSVVTGNDTIGTGIDLQSDRRPRLEGTVCERSQQGEAGPPFGVCLED